MTPAVVRIVLADDHPIVLRGLAQLFSSQSGFEVVASCTNGDEALQAVRRASVDVLVLDLRMSGRSGLDVLRDLAGKPTGCRVVVLTASVSGADAAEAIRLGARGLVLKESTPEELIECVRSVHSGEQWVDRGTMGRAFDAVALRESATRDLFRLLTRREIAIVRLVAEGLRNREIAERLKITEGTVKIHLHNIYEKLGIDGRLELLVRVQSSGLFEGLSESIEN